MMSRYDHAMIEEKWRKVWLDEKLDQTDITGALKICDAKHMKAKLSANLQGKPFYNLMMFPYPSAEGLHVGNMYAFTGSDIYGRFKRMQGYNVFEPIGLDGFGIHSENYSLKIGRHPMEHAKITQKNFYTQLHTIGAMFDWSRTLETYDPDYYRWTQWIFVAMFKHGLAYRGRANVNWCPKDKTVLADEQVIDGCCERCGNKVETRLLEQWFFRITAYAEKLLENLLKLDWSEKIKVSQKNWIGKKEGIIIKYRIEGKEGEEVGIIECFTTRSDTNFGATFVAIAPEHPFVVKLLKASPLKGVRSSEYIELPEEKRTEIAAYVKKHAGVSETERVAQGRKKTGVFTGLYCVNQLNNYKMPLYISDFVVMGVGTGAVVGVPGVDPRDFEFAEKFRLPVIQVIEGEDGKEGKEGKEAKMVNSGFLNGLRIPEAIEKMIVYLEEKGWGKRQTTYHLRDWLISRQRYWGPPIPMIFCQSCARQGRSWFTLQGATFKGGTKIDQDAWEHLGWFPVPEDQLPVVLPRIEDYKPGDDGVSPLAKHKEFYNVVCPSCGKPARRETDVSDTFLDSSWYFLRYPSIGSAEVASSNTRVLRSSASASAPSAQGSHLPKLPALPFDSEVTRRWLPVDMYTGGAEHSVLHLMYARFVWKCFCDWGYFDFSAQGGPALGWEEPFTRFYAHGLLIKDGAKMSKSKGNVINPDEYINLYGADSLRLYLMFMGPFDKGGDFRDTAMEGMSRWVNRVWRLSLNSLSHLSTLSTLGNLEIKRALQKLVKKVTEDIEKRRYNTAIAAMMEFTNEVSHLRGGGKGHLGGVSGVLGKEELATFIKLLAPFAPHLTEELYQRIMNYDLRITNQNQENRKSYFVNRNSIHVQPWPEYDPSEMSEEFVQMVVQINGKLRDKLNVSVQQSKDHSAIEELARNRERVKKFLEGKKVVKSVFVPGRLINFVL